MKYSNFLTDGQIISEIDLNSWESCLAVIRAEMGHRVAFREERNLNPIVAL